MLGYYKNQEATDAAIDDEKWLHTGDMGTIDKDNNIFLKGRCKTMLLGPSGQNIYPEIIEAKLSNLPFVAECLVIQQKNKLIALVYPDFAAMDEGHVGTNDLDAIMEENRLQLNKLVASYENISKIVIHPKEFEKTPKKSIKRFLYENISNI
jgi:long-chain acyl-CoA synthetase